MGTLSGKNAVVTGSTSGIGLAYARAFAAAGANVVINGFGSPEDIEKERAEHRIRFRREGGLFAGRHDQAGRDRRDDRARREELWFGRHPRQQCRHPVRLADRGVPDREMGPDHRDQPVLGLPCHPRRRARHEEEGWGRIINTASAHSLVASPFKSAYVSAKHGIAGLTKTVALEVATHKITCNCISPGYVWTPLVEKQIPDTMKARNLTREQVINDVLLDAQPTKEFVTSEQVAALALFLCGDDAAQITGTNLSIDGGWTAE